MFPSKIHVVLRASYMVHVFPSIDHNMDSVIFILNAVKKLRKHFADTSFSIVQLYIDILKYLMQIAKH